MSVEDTKSFATPVSDLSYRGYDGPLHGTQFRWWVIAKNCIAKAGAITSLKVVSALSAWYYVVMIIIMFVFEEFSSLAPQGGEVFKRFMSNIVWRDQFVYGFSYAQHLILVVTLILGAGAIANDNRANALLVYLSKPCTKVDYMVGKWIGIFLPILAVISVPTIAFYLYGIVSFREQGFFRDDPYLFFKVIAVLPLSAALHTSLILAFSSAFKQGRIAGAAYAGVYFLSFFFTVLMSSIWGMGAVEKQGFLKAFSYCSIDGIQIGLAKAILNPSGSMAFGFPARAGGMQPVPSPELLPYVLLVLAITLGCLGFVWTRIRAVEVV